MRSIVMLTALLATSAVAASPDSDRQSGIVVSGHGVARQVPDVASLSFGLRGEGRSADAATKALVAMRDAVVASLATVGVPAEAVHTGALSMDQVRDKSCDRGNEDDYNNRPRLSEGACAVVGFVARLDATVTLSPKEAGTAGGLMARAGASDVRVESYDLSDDKAVRRAAIGAALTDARTQAEAIAAGAGEKLGPLLSVRDENAPAAMDIVVTAARRAAPAMAPPPPVVVSLNPSPVERSANLIVTYAIER